MTDLSAWNADATRMPYRMHSEYLRKLFLNNDLAAGRFKLKERSLSLHDIRIPIFAVSTERDHIAPWRSVYKVTRLTNSDVTFVLASGGHNVGIVSEPGRDVSDRVPRHFRMGVVEHDGRHVDAEAWLRQAEHHEGSWWPAWTCWLVDRSTGTVPAHAPGARECGFPPLADAPGAYVLQR